MEGEIRCRVICLLEELLSPPPVSVYTFFGLLPIYVHKLSQLLSLLPVSVHKISLLLH